MAAAVRDDVERYQALEQRCDALRVELKATRVKLSTTSQRAFVEFGKKLSDPCAITLPLPGMVMRGRFETNDGLQDWLCQVILVHPKYPSAVCAVETKACMRPWIIQVDDLQPVSPSESLAFLRRVAKRYSAPAEGTLYNKLYQLRKIDGNVGQSPTAIALVVGSLTA